MKIIVTGAEGQLGSELCERLSELKYEVFRLSKLELDISDENKVSALINQIQPDVVINTAAYTKVDDCEAKYQTAYNVNVIGPRNLARACDRINAKLVHFSTDFVFSGHARRPYFEYDSTDPCSVYGKTKLAGEFEIKHYCKSFFIIRTSWLYGKYGNNFVKTMIHLSQTKKALDIVNDQIGSPTWVTDLIEALLVVIETDKFGIYHYSNAGECNWSEFANEIFKGINAEVEIREISSQELNRPAERPKYSVMDTQRIQTEFNIKINKWETSLIEFLKSQNYIQIGE